MTLFSPSRIILQNFRAVLGKLEYEFEQQPGLYFVAGRNELRPRMGPNGVGKSSVYSEALSWVLQGQTSRAKAPGSDVENWSTEKGLVSVAFEFHLGDEYHCIERTRRPNKLMLDGTICTQAEIDALLPLSDAALRRTLLIDQFATMFLSVRPEEKSKIFSDALGLDVWLRAADYAGRNLAEAERRVAQLREDLAGYEAGLAEMRDQLEEARNRERAFETQRTDRITKMRSEKKALLEKMAETANGLDAAKSLGATTQRREAKRKHADLQAQERGLVADIAQLAAAFEAADALRSQLNSRLRQYRDSDLCPECGQKVTKQHVAERRKALEQQLSDTASAAEKVDGRIEKQRRKLPGLREDVAQAHAALIAAESAYAGYEKWETRDRLERSALASLNERLEDARVEKNVFAESAKRLRSRIEERTEERKDAKEEYEALQEKADIYRFWQRGFREIRLEQIDATLLELEIAANRHADELGLEGWEISFSTERETARGSVSHKFTVMLRSPDQEREVSWEAYSGGESQRLQLAVTFGLAEVLLSRSGLQTDFEVLDEPTPHLSAEGIEDLLECLYNRAHDLGRRIYLIDHHSLERGSFDKVISVVRDKEGVYLE